MKSIFWSLFVLLVVVYNLDSSDAETFPSRLSGHPLIRTRRAAYFNIFWSNICNTSCKWSYAYNKKGEFFHRRKPCKRFNSLKNLCKFCRQQVCNRGGQIYT